VYDVPVSPVYNLSQQSGTFCYRGRTFLSVSKFRYFQESIASNSTAFKHLSRPWILAKYSSTFKDF